MAKNISEQLQDILRKVDIDNILRYFKNLKEHRRELEKEGTRSQQLRFAMA